MARNAAVYKTEGESAVNLIRRFSRRVQGAHVIKRVRAGRYFERPASRTVVRKRALKGLKRKLEVIELIKLGKMTEKPKTRGRR